MSSRPSMATVVPMLPTLTSSPSSRSSSVSSFNNFNSSTSPDTTMNTVSSPVFTHLLTSTDPDTEAEVPLDEDLTAKAHFILTNVQTPATRPLIKKFLSPRLDTRASCLDSLCLQKQPSRAQATTGYESQSQTRRQSAPSAFRILDTTVDTRERKVWIWSELEPSSDDEDEQQLQTIDEQQTSSPVGRSMSVGMGRRGSKQARIDMMAFDAQGLLVWAFDCSRDVDDEDDEGEEY